MILKVGKYAINQCHFAVGTVIVREDSSQSFTRAVAEVVQSVISALGGVSFGKVCWIERGVGLKHVNPSWESSRHKSRDNSCQGLYSK